MKDQQHGGPSTASKVIAALCALFVLALVLRRYGPALMGKNTQGPAPQAQGEPLHENSGLARMPGGKGYWSVADSGSAPVLYALDAQGLISKAYPVDVPANIDWEDLASDGEGRIFVGDIGDNYSRRPELSVIELSLDASFEPRFEPRAVYRFDYPEQDPSLISNGDAEGLVFLSGQLYVFSKRRSDTRSIVYRIQADPALSGKRQRAERIADVDIRRPQSWVHFGDMLTATAIDASGRRLAIATYRSVLVFEDLRLPAWKLAEPRAPERSDARLLHLLAREPIRYNLPFGDTRQVEGIVFVDGRILLSNEEGKIFDLEKLVAAAPSG